MMTLMLDGKEINDLLTTLINKFDNIASFIDVLDELGLYRRFEPEYSMFADSKMICEDLKFINSFARMSSFDNTAKRKQYRDALVILGMELGEQEIDKYLDENVFMIDENGKKLPKTKGRHDFRNFIASNVIDSSRFRYLVKYSSADGMIKLKKNEKLISFVLEKLPDAQTEHYYESCKLDPAVIDKKTRIQKLTELIRVMDFNDFVKVNIKNNADENEKQNKAKYQAMISLYLMVLYQIVKNMIYVNSRYVLAFHCLERDFELYSLPIDVGQDKYKNCFALTHLFIDKGYINRKNSAILKSNYSNTDHSSIKKYRNHIDHFAVIRELGKYASDIAGFGSWFELYHYIIQRIVCIDPKNDSERRYSSQLLQYKTYCMDYVKALNSPFGYSLARYKNLSIKDKFDKNECK